MSNPKTKRVTHPDAISTLTDLRRLNLLSPFFRGDVRLAELAPQADLKLNTLWYRVNKWCQQGILEVVHEERRKGRPIKLYRTTAEAFFVPFTATKNLELQEMLMSFIAQEEQVFYRGVASTLESVYSDLGLYISTMQDEVDLMVSLANQQDDQVSLISDTFIAMEGPAMFLSDGTIGLDFSTAKRFQQELRMLYQKYKALSSEQAQLYAYRLGITPLNSEFLTSN